MTEAQLEEHVRQLALCFGLLRFHVRDARGMTRGFPDDVIIGPLGVLWRELKSEAGALSPEQRQVGYALQAAGQDWACWRPRDLRSGVIHRQLSAIR